MAVKVMWARAREEKSSACAPESAREARAPAALEGPRAVQAVTAVPARPERAEKPKRRRSSVYDADGNEVFITLVCLKCHKARPLAQFGLRRMADGAIRNQPWCKTCRAASGTRSSRRSEEPAVSGESPVSEESSRTPPATPQGNLAAQIAAALHAGRR